MSDVCILYSGLVDRVNEMRYANRLNAFEREAAHAAIRNRVIQPVLPNNGQAQQQKQLINGENKIAQINEHHLQLQNFDRGVEGLQQQLQVRLNHHDVLDYQRPDELQVQEQLDEDVQNEGLGGRQAQAEEEQRQLHDEDQNEKLQSRHHEGEEEQQQQYDQDQHEAVGNLAQAQQIPVPVPGVGERRPYHAPARENAEALNRLLTREVPILTQQLQNTMELMNQLIRRQLNN